MLSYPPSRLSAWRTVTASLVLTVTLFAPHWFASHSKGTTPIASIAVAQSVEPTPTPSPTPTPPPTDSECEHIFCG